MKFMLATGTCSLLVFATIAAANGQQFAQARALAAEKDGNYRGSCALRDFSSSGDYETYVFDCGNGEIAVTCDIKQARCM